MKEPKGLMAVMISPKEEKKLTAKDNEATMKRLMKDWNLGPEKASADPTANAEYWKSMGRVWGTTEQEARRHLCANCEYFDNSPAQMERMDAVPFNDVDADGGGRGYCHKFEFICHNLRTCQAWEEEPKKMGGFYD